MIGFGGGNTSGPIDVATAQTARGQRLDFDTETFIAHSLRGEVFDASEDGTGRGTPIVPVQCIHSDVIGHDGIAKSDSVDAAGVSRKRDAGMGIGDDVSFNLTTGAPHAIAFSSKDYGNDATDDLSPTLRSMGHDKSHAHGGGQMAIAWSNMPQNSGNDFKARPVDVAQPLMAGGPVGGNQGGDYIQQAWQVRRLTPTECERLQAFPDGFTDITYRGKRAADGPRYKALGNSWAASNGEWILARLAALLEQRRLAA